MDTKYVVKKLLNLCTKYSTNIFVHPIIKIINQF